MKENKKYYLGLDIIRILACILIFLYHLNIIKGGFLAVCTFFALSGFLECTSALNKEDFSIKSYYINRIKKIYLPLIFVVSITLIIVKQFPLISWINLKPETTSVLLGYNNFWQISANLDYFTRHISSPFMHMWFIAILVQFDLIFPIVFKLLKKISEKNNKLSIFLVLLVTVLTTIYFVIASYTKNIMLVYYDTLARCFSLLFGVLLALLVSKYDLKVPKYFQKVKALIFLGYLAILFLLCFLVSSDSSYYYLYMIFITIVSCRLILYSINSNKEIESNKEKIIKWISNITYEIYLIQYPVLFFVQNLLQKSNYQVLIVSLLTILLSIIIHFILSIKHNHLILKIIKIALICLVIVFGLYILVMEEDHTAEMNELEQVLNETSLAIEKKNEEYLEKLHKEQEDWNAELINMENEEAQIADIVHNLPVVGVGDSVLLAAAPGLYSVFPNGYFDGKVSRTIVGGKEVLLELESEGKLGKTIILALANNGDYITKRNKDLMEVLKDKEVYWVNAVKADIPEFNDYFKEFAKDYDNLHIVDWVEASKDHPEYFYADGIHVKGDGIKAYGNTVYEAIYNDYLNEYKAKKDEIIKKHEEELKAKIGFYGNDALVNIYSFIFDSFPEASYNSNMFLNFEELYTNLQEKINNQTLEYKVVLMFNKDFNITLEEYQKIVDLCLNHEVIITKMTDFSNSIINAKLIDFYDDILNNDDYLLADKVHLSKNGNQALANLIISNLK